MGGSTELLLLRLALLVLIFGFVWVVSLSLRRALTPMPARVPQPSAEKRRPGWRLVVESPGDSALPPGAEFGLAGRMTIGRDGDAGIMLAESSVSARHAAIERVQGGWRIVDLGSTNGTTVNGRTVPPNGVLLRGGERLTFGAVVVRLTPPARN